MALKTTIIANNITIKNIIQILPNWGFKSHFKHTFKKARLITLLILSFLSFEIGLAQSIGDFRSIVVGPLEWTNVTSWQTWNGSGWVNATSYPGQNAGSYITTIQTDHTISISTNLFTTQLMGNVIVNGTLFLDGPNQNTTALITLNTPKLIFDFGKLNFNKSKTNLYLPASSLIEFKNGGNIIGDCTANTRIFINNSLIAACVGNGNIIDFEDLVRGGGTLNAVISPNPIPSVCLYQTIVLNGSYTGTLPSPTPPITYKWFVTYPNEITEELSTNQNITFTLNEIGNYIFSLVVTTVIDGKNHSNIEQAIVSVNPLPTTPTITAGSATTFCTGGSVNLTASAGTFYSWSTGASTQSITVSTSGNYTVRVTNASGCQSAESAATAVTINPTNTWNGSISAVWNNPSNWSCGVPTPNSDIIIPSGITTQYPTLNVEITLRNVDIQNGALLNVLNNGLTITGNLTLNGKIDLQNESQLIQTEGSSLVSDCATGKIEINQQGTSDCFSYNYWGSPVNTSCGLINNNINEFLKDGSFPNNIKSFLYGSSAYYADSKSTPLNNGTPNLKLSTYWMYKFANKTAGDYNRWTHIGNTGQLLAGEGFTLKGSNTNFTYQNYTFVGKPNNGLIELTVDQGMQYLIGNPYPSAIDAREFIKDNILQYIGTDGTHNGRRSENIIDGNLYFWDHYGYSTHALKSYQGGYAIYNLSGEVAFQRESVSGLPPPVGAVKTPRQYIPVAQGFFVNGLTNSGKIQFKNNQRFYQKEENGISEFIRTSDKNSIKNQTSELDLTKRIYLKYNSPSGFQRQILVAFIPKTTEGIDIGYDAINNEKFAEDMSWANADNKFVIQAVPTLENRILPLEVKVSAKGISKISIDHIDNISEDITILLKDNLNGMIYNLKTAPFEINLSPGTYTNRFELVLRSQQTLTIDEENIVDNGINIHLNNTENTIFINKSNLFEIKEISIHNMLGQQIQSIKKGLEHQIVKIPLNVQSGVYIVNVITDKGSVSKKIIKF